MISINLRKSYMLRNYLKRNEGEYDRFNECNRRNKLL